jgi:glycosyltransferase involved in cell wall biosynthesis/protein-tyrosine-phosphatase
MRDPAMTAAHARDMTMHGRAYTAQVKLESASPMRVCHIASGDLWAGAEVQLATCAAYLAARAEISLSAVVLNEGPLAERLRWLGIDVVVLDERKRGPIEILITVARFLAQRKIDLIHTHRYKENILGTLAAKLAGVPHVVRTVHGLNEALNGWRRVKMEAYEALDKVILWSCADVTIAVSRRIAEALVMSGLTPARVTCLPNGVDLDRVKPARAPEDIKRELGLDPGALVVGTVGRLSPVKGHDCLLRAAPLILQQAPHVRLVVVGDGPRKPELVRRAAQLGVAGRCIFVGSRNDVYDLMAAMDIFVLPSLDEGIPMALLEAMALARPIVATSVGGVPEIVQHRSTGLLVQPNDERALADACLELTVSREWARTLGARARRIVATEYSQTRNGQALLDLYRRLSGADKADGRASRLAFPVQWLLRHTRRRLDNAIERWRMHRVRSNPTAVATALRSAHTILIVCHGNIIRSAFAACALVQRLGDRSRVSVVSGGLEAVPGDPAHPTALASATSLGFDISGHRAVRVTPEQVASADLIFVMEIAHLRAMRQRFPDACAKTFLLTCLAPDTPLEIRDPVAGGEAVFRECFDHIIRAVRPIAPILHDATRPASSGLPVLTTD